MLRSTIKYILMFCPSYSLLLRLEHESSSTSEQDRALPLRFSISDPLPLKQGDHEWKWDTTQGQRHTTSSRGSQLGVKWPVIFLAISSLFWRRWKCHTRLMVLFLGKAKVSLMTLGQKDRRLAYPLGSSDIHLKFSFQGFLVTLIWVLDRDHVEY